MKLAFLVGSTGISGGTNVILEHSKRLKDSGWDVYAITADSTDDHRLSWHPGASELNWISVEQAKFEVFDVVVATWWQSVLFLHEFTAEHYVYFVQSIESRFFPTEDTENVETRDIDILRSWAESTYRYPLPIITEAGWIQKYLRHHYSKKAYLVRNGVRKDLYSAEGSAVSPRVEGKLRVLVEGPLGVFYKNVEKTIMLCRQVEGIEIWLLTSSEVSEYPGVDRCFSQVPVYKTAEIYRSCDVLVKLSYIEGMFGPPLEMFHCGGTAIVYDVTGHDEYIVDGENALVVSRDDEPGVVRCLQQLVNDGRLLQRLKEQALETARRWPDWKAAADAFAAVLQQITATGSLVSPSILNEHAEYYLQVREDSSAARSLKRLAEREKQYSDVEAAGLHNYLQVYWHSGDGFVNEQMVSAHYQTGGKAECSVVVPATDSNLHVRIDPSVRIGLITIQTISLHDEANGRLLQKWDTTTGFSEVYVTGTANCLFLEPELVVFAYGEDPQILLPGVYTVAAESNSLRVDIELREQGITETIQKHYHSAVTPNLRSRLFRKIQALLTNKVNA